LTKFTISIQTLTNFICHFAIKHQQTSSSEMGIDPRLNDLRATSQTGTGTGATTPDIDRPEGENPDGEDEAEEPEGKLKASENHRFAFMSISSQALKLALNPTSQLKKNKRLLVHLVVPRKS
jgi:hypothetical protein